MCYSGKCRYENWDGECNLNSKIKPPDSLCVEDDVEERSAIDDDSLLSLKEMDEFFKKENKI